MVPQETTRLSHPIVARPKVRINIARFWDGATADGIVQTILPDLEPYVDFEISSSPQVLLYGPYPGQMPGGRFTRVFIGCENVRPIMTECDWAFGVAHEDCVNHPRYMRFARWGDDSSLVQNEKDWAAILRSKTRFCAFVYANPAFYRQAFFTALSRYKRVDSPGRSMNNMPSIDPVPGRPDWSAKIAFLRNYKFVIAFENSVQAGYNTEKLTHAIEADSLPIYWGDPQIERSFNVRRFINARDYLPVSRVRLPRLPYRPHSTTSRAPPTLLQRAARRLNGISGEMEQRFRAYRGFDALIERIIQIDRDDELYLQHLLEPFLPGNRLPDRSRWIDRWRQIFADCPP